MVGSTGLFGFAGLGLREAVAVAVHFEDVNVMRQAFGAEYGCPVLEGQVGGEKRGATFVALRDDLEQHLHRFAKAARSPVRR